MTNYLCMYVDFRFNDSHTYFLPESCQRKSLHIWFCSICLGWANKPKHLLVHNGDFGSIPFRSKIGRVFANVVVRL